MNNSDKAKNLALAYENIQKEMEGFFEPHIKAWLQVQVDENSLTKEEAEADFHYSGESWNGLAFESEDWEETWQYGGYEKHYGREISIPFEFFDNPEEYVAKAKAKKEAAVLQRRAEKLAHEQAKVARLQRQLELAQARLNKQ